MSKLTTAMVDADISMLMGSLNSKNRVIPSSIRLLKLSFAVPAISILAAFLSDIIGYMRLYGSQSTLEGYCSYFLSDGWAVVLPTVIIGLLFAFMTYNNLIMYMAVPDDARRNSLILSHLRDMARRTVMLFIFLMFVSVALSYFTSWIAFAIPGLEFSLLIVVSLVVGMEINRLGAGLALEKVSNLLKKI